MDSEKNRVFDIRERVFNYALRAIKLYQFVYEDKSSAGHIIGKQFLKSATSVGANIEEAQSAESNADFIHKLAIAQKEIRESLYWLRLLEKSELVSQKRIIPIIQETDEIVAIITSIIKNTKTKK